MSFQEEIKAQKERVKWVIGGIDFNDLTEWEEKFLEDIERKTMSGKWLSERQMEIVERIYKEKGK